MKQLRKRLREGDVIFGQMVLELFTSGIGPMLAASGMDFVLYDMEHGRCDITLLAQMVASCRGATLCPWPAFRILAFARYRGSWTSEYVA